MIASGESLPLQPRDTQRHRRRDPAREKARGLGHRRVGGRAQPLCRCMFVHPRHDIVRRLSGAFSPLESWFLRNPPRYSPCDLRVRRASDESPSAGSVCVSWHVSCDYHQRCRMSNRPTIVCPVDFSEPSSTALNYAATVADHFGARLLVVTIDDPLLAVAAENAGLQALSQQTEEGLRRFVDSAVSPAADHAASIEFVVAVGKPAAEILRIAQDSASDLIVMGSHGRSGITKKFFGSTTERVLHETSIPVLVTPATAQRVARVTDVSRHVQRVVAPVDLTEASPRQTRIAAGMADGLGVPLLLAHVLEPMYVPPRVRVAIPDFDRDRRAAAERQVRELSEACA